MQDTILCLFVERFTVQNEAQETQLLIWPSEILGRKMG